MREPNSVGEVEVKYFSRVRALILDHPRGDRAIQR